MVDSKVARPSTEDSWRAARSLPSFYALAAANLFPIVGLTFLGWRGESLIALYLLEAIVVYLITARMLAVVAAQRELQLVGRFLVRSGLGLLMMGFFSAFMLGQSTLWASKGHPADVPGAIFSESGILLSAVAMIASHAISYFKDFIGRKEYDRLPWKAIEARMHAIFFGMFIAMLGAPVLAFFRSPAPFAAVLVIVKTLVALSAFVTERARGGDGSVSLTADYATPTTACPHCGKPLRTNRAKQCFHCGADWHTK